MPDFRFRNRQIRVVGKRPLVCAATQPNAGLRLHYQRKLDQYVTELHNSILYWLTAAWRKQPTLAMDETTVQAIRRLFSRLGRRWQRNFDKLAPELADYFAQQSRRRVDSKLKAMLKQGGMSVEFVMSAQVRQAYQAVIGENVGLIRSIAAEHLAKVEQQVMRSVAAGRDLVTLTKDIEAQYGLTRRRAALIARDQNNKATSVIHRARMQELGITQAKWRHSHGGNVPRPTHVAMDGKLYDVTKGMWDADESKFIHPGELINCRCVSQPIIQGF